MPTLIKAVAVLLALGCATPIARPQNQDDFFHQTFENKLFASAFFDSKKNQFAKKLVDRLLNDLVVVDFIKARGIVLAATDLADVPMLKEHYEIPGTFAFFFYVHNQLQRFDDFAELAEDFLNQKLLYADLLEEVSKFLRGRLERINAPLRSMEDFGQALAAHKIVAVYLGRLEGFFFGQFADFAAKHADFHFYHAANNFVADQIYQQTKGLPRPQEKDLFAIVRSKALLDDMDTEALVAIDAHKLLEDYKVFFEYQRYPKLRDASHGDNLFYRLYNAGQKLVLFVYNDQSPLEHLSQFKKAVFLLPRIFMFAHVNTMDAKFGSFMQMFIQAGQNPTEDRVYIFHSVAGKLFAEVVPAGMDAEKIVEGVGRYFQHHRALFTDAERAIVGDAQDQGEAEPGEGEERAEDPELVYSEL